MADVQLENGYIRIANELYDALWSFNFSEYEHRIIKFIIRLSYGCGKKTAYLRFWNDFTVAGVPASRIKSKIEKLKSENVITIDTDLMEFGINKDYDTWSTDRVVGYDEERFNLLLKFNLNNSQLDYTKSKLGYTNGIDTELYKKYSEVDKKANETIQKVNSGLYKKSTPTADNSNDSLLESPPKDNIKKDKENNITSKEVATPVGDVMDIFKNQVGPKGWFPRGPRHHDLITELAEKYTLEQIGDGIKEALKVNASLTLPGALQYIKTTIEGMIAVKEKQNKAYPVYDRVKQVRLDFEQWYPEIQAYKDGKDIDIVEVKRTYIFLLDELKEYPEAQELTGHTIDELESEYQEVLNGDSRNS